MRERYEDDPSTHPDFDSDLWMEVGDTAKRLMSSSKYRSVEVINNQTRPGSNHKEVNYINYK